MRSGYGGATSEHSLAATATDSAGPISAQRAWWKAFVVADMAYLQASSARDFSLTLSSGQTYDRVTMLAEAMTHTEGHSVHIDWADESVRFPEPGVAIVSSRVTETSGVIAVYRYLTVLQRASNEWRVTAAKSTREIALTPRVPTAAAEQLSDFEGRYLTPKGAILRVTVRDAQVTLVEPSGKQIPLAPVGPEMFELDLLSLNKGLVRLVFTRDASGKVVSFSRLIMGQIDTFRRVP